jgi:alpha-mannosidase
VLLDPLYWDRLSRAWNDFAPSTHHDYITGTSPDWVAQLEQLPLLQTAYDEASRSAEQALDALAASVGANAGDVVIANPSGVQFNGLVELPAPGLGGMKSIEIGETSTSVPVQATFEGGSVFAAGVQSTGYITGTPSSQEANATSTATISPESPGADSYTLQNEFMTVVVDAASHWGISSLVDASGNPLLAANGIGNDLVFYADTGNLYQFGNEIPEATFSPAGLTVETVGDGLGPVILETGPLRVRLKTVVSIAIEGTNLPAQLYTREYCLVAGEPFLRMTTTGAAPNVGDWAQTGYSVMTAFPLASKVDSLTHGTPCHWTTTQPYDYWAPPVFQPTHHFVLPMAGGELLAAIYHHEVVAWGYDGNGVLLGCLLRNTPAGGRGASGSDPDTHTLRYALRVSSGLGDPSTGQPLSEALSYVAPAMARIAPGVAVDVPDTLPGNGFIASVSPPGVIQAAKPGDVTPGTLILRIYQPSNSSQKLTVTLGRGQPAAVVAVTALEDPITSDAPAIETSDTGFTIQATTALSTVQVSFPEW